LILLWYWINLRGATIKKPKRERNLQFTCRHRGREKKFTSGPELKKEKCKEKGAGDGSFDRSGRMRKLRRQAP